MRFIGFDRVSLDPNKIVKDDADELVIKTVLASEIVHKYPDGMAYKPADELAKGAWTLDGRHVKSFDHPDTGLLQRKGDVSGFIDNVNFVKNLVDPKTKRPNRRGIVADVHLFKNDSGRPGCAPLDEATVDRILAGDIAGVSVGFTFIKDETPGSWNGSDYDYIQRDFFFDHVASPIEVGRCPLPYCGLGVDALIGLDPWETTEEYIRSGHKSPGDFDPNSLRTIDITEGIRAVVGCPKGKFDDGKCSVGVQVQSYLFDKDKFTLEEAKAWFAEHEGDSLPGGLDMNLSEIREKIAEIKARRDAIKKWLDDYYEAKTEGRDPEVEAKYSELDDIHTELSAWNEALVKRIVSEGGADQETKEEFIARCVEEGKSEEECEAAWEESGAVDAAEFLAAMDGCLKDGGDFEGCLEQLKEKAPFAGDCLICDLIKKWGPRRFAKRMVTTFGSDVLRMLGTVGPSALPAPHSLEGDDILAREEEVVELYKKLHPKT